MSKKQSIRDQINDLIRTVVTNNNLLLTTPLLVDFFDGDHNAAILLNQILYWTERTSDPDGWFYKTYEDWHTELRFSPYQVRRVIQGDDRVQNPKRTLWEVGLETIVRMAPNGRNATFYRLDVPQFVGMLAEWLEDKFGRIASRFIPTERTAASADNSVNVTKKSDPQPQQHTPEVKATERIQSAWNSPYGADGKVEDAWNIAYNQLELQFDRASFESYIRDVHLVDYQPEEHVFWFVVDSEYAVMMLCHRLYRNIHRVLTDAFGEDVQLRFLTAEQWRLSQLE